MTEHHDIVSRTEEFVFDLFKRKLPDYLVYHTYAHTESVAKSARKLAEDMELGEEGVEAVVLASLLHDTGYTELYKGHEDVSIRIATEYLRAQALGEERIAVIAGCIRATRIPQSPRNILEEIVADADLSSLGKKSYFERSELLRIEWERAQGRHYTDDEWLEQNIDLLSRHTFFTRAAQERYGARQAENLRRLYKTKAERVPEVPAEITEAAIQPQPEPVATNTQVSEHILHRNAQADQRSQFLFLVGLLCELFIVAMHRWFTQWMYLFAALLLASILITTRAMIARFPTASGTLEPEVVAGKERQNRLALGLLLVGIVGPLIALILRDLR
jgi:HD superfamily phosphodiesterase